jgi:hypothetical protein
MLVEESDVALNDDERGDRRRSERERVRVAVVDRHERQRGDVEVEAGPIEERRQRDHLRLGDRLIRGDERLEDFIFVALEHEQFARRHRDREIERERRPFDVEGDLEVQRLEVPVVDDDALGADLVEGQRP